MGKIENLKSYIKKCEVIDNQRSAKYLAVEIIAVYSEEIDNIKGYLNMYSYDADDETNYIEDCNILMAKLINYRDNLEQEEKKCQYEMEKMKLQQAKLQVTNSNINENSNSTDISLNVSTDQVLDVLADIPESMLSKVDKEFLEDKLSAIEIALYKDDKNKVKEKIVGILKFIGDKGIDVAIAMLPYLGSIVQNINI